MINKNKINEVSRGIYSPANAVTFRWLQPSKKLILLLAPLCAVSVVRAAVDAAMAHDEEFDDVPARVSVCDRVSNAMREAYAAGYNKAGQIAGSVGNGLAVAKTNTVNACLAVKQAAQNKFNAAQANLGHYRNEIRDVVAERLNQAERVAAQKIIQAKLIYAFQKPVVEAQVQRALEKTKQATNKLMKTRIAGSVKRKAGEMQDSINYWLEEDDHDKSWASKNPKKTAGLVVSSAVLADMVYGHQQLDLVNNFNKAKRAVLQKLGWETPETKIA